jgi:hypothetical protein
MITLGSTGLINQIISGLFVIYSKSVKSGDYVRIGDVEGEVINVGSLATKLRTPRQEEITLPHSVLVETATTNYSRLAGEDGMVITVSVTIGYDVPWRQVHALLLLGASRTRIRQSRREQATELWTSMYSITCWQYLEEGKSASRCSRELHAQIKTRSTSTTRKSCRRTSNRSEKAGKGTQTAWYALPASQPSAWLSAERSRVKRTERENILMTCQLPSPLSEKKRKTASGSFSVAIPGQPPTV